MVLPAYFGLSLAGPQWWEPKEGNLKGRVRQRRRVGSSNPTRTSGPRWKRRMLRRRSYIEGTE